ncbi:MAG: DUF481 domain-containing protein [Bacteroidales bacterium]|nr:DUF481 domain-containing protein [Bacteroidales bacterium]
MFRILILSILLFYHTWIYSQVVNIEKLRSQDTSKPVVGKTELTFDVNRSINTIFTLKNSTRLQYNYLKNTYLWLADLQMMQVDTIRYISNGFLHFRYNYDFRNKWLIAEAYTQIQFNRIQKILRRFLWGSGFRYVLFNLDKYKIFAGTSIMYEFELYIDKTYKDNVRNTFYVSINLKPNDTFLFSHTTYYQPQIDNFLSYRITNETAIDAVIIKNLSFRTKFNYFYDSKPAPAVQKIFYSLHNGIAYKF